jgi:hypothetical protein
MSLAEVEVVDQPSTIDVTLEPEEAEETNSQQDIPLVSDSVRGRLETVMKVSAFLAYKNNRMTGRVLTEKEVSKRKNLRRIREEKAERRRELNGWHVISEDPSVYVRIGDTTEVITAITVYCKMNGGKLVAQGLKNIEDIRRFNIGYY